VEKNDLPQDSSALNGVTKELCYVKNERGCYETVLSAGWEAKSVALDTAWEVINERIEEAKQKVIEGKNSPILFFMEKNLMDIGILSCYVQMSKLRVAVHLKPWGYKMARSSIKQRYAEIFKISVDELNECKG